MAKTKTFRKSFNKTDTIKKWVKDGKTFEKFMEESGYFKKIAEGCFEMAKKGIEPTKENCLKLNKKVLDEMS